ncbi:MAG: hypothetical protein VR78_11025 [Hoeflea sp. BRH_c9]|nr:MAG: hypothetical protein VR78_11025 [Hoeflea sp. BRH_c9]
MFETIKAVLGFAGQGAEGVPMPKSSLAMSPEIPVGSFGGGVETAHMPGIYRELGDAVADSTALTSARAVHALINSDLGGAVDAAIGQIVGTGLRPNVQPVAELIGWTADEADQWARRVERLFALWAENPDECDSAGLQSFGQMQRTVMRGYFGTGEALALYPVAKRRGDMFRAKVQLLDARRLSGSNIIERDRHGLRFQGGRPVGLLLKDRDPVSGLTDWEDRFVPFRSKSGRPLSALIFDHLAPVQWRGISPLVGALKPHFQFGRLADATLAGSLLQATLAAVITSSATSEEVMQVFSSADSDQSAMDSYVSAKLAWYAANSLKGLPNAIHLLPGETLDFKSVDTDSAENLADFARLLKLESARALGIGYSQATGDYSGATYSSVRMESATNWPLVLQRRKSIAGRFCQSSFEAWLENAILDGIVSVPGGYSNFMALRKAFVRCEWRGPSMPQADENKSANASKTRLSTGTTSLAYECEAMGLDWTDVLAQRAREKQFAARIGLPDPHVADPASVALPTGEQATIEHTTMNGHAEALTFSQAADRVAKLEAEARALPAQYVPSAGEVAKTTKLRREHHNEQRAYYRNEIASLEAQIEQKQEAA